VSPFDAAVKNDLVGISLRLLVNNKTRIIRLCKTYYDIFSRFDTMCRCDRQTDGQIDRQV